MPAIIYYDNDADLKLLDGKTVAIIGYGSQGHAHALNLHDSGVNVVVGLYEGSKSKAKAEADGLTVKNTADAVKDADIVMMLLQDHLQGKVYKADVEPNLKPGAMLMFAHGFSIHYGQIVAPENVDVSMIAPKGPGHIVRSMYVEGVGVPGADRRAAGPDGHRPPARPRLREGDEGDQGGRRADDLQGGDGERPLRRAGCPLRRRHLADPQRLRDAGQRGLSAGDRLLRGAARDETDRGPDVSGRHVVHALLGLGYGGVRRLHLRPAHLRRRGAREDGTGLAGHPERQVRPASGSRRTRPVAARSSCGCATRRRTPRSSASARNCAR